jgi:hypothetical protein
MQKRCLQRLRTQKLREEKAKKEWEKNFNDYKPMQSHKKEWRAKKMEKTLEPAEQKEKIPELTSSDDEMDLLDYPLIKDGSPPPESMVMNMVCILLVEFGIMEKEMVELCLGPKNVAFKKLDDSVKHLKHVSEGTHRRDSKAKDAC